MGMAFFLRASDGKGSPKVLLTGTNVWSGHYIYAPNGTRYKSTIGDNGLPVNTAE